MKKYIVHIEKGYETEIRMHSVACTPDGMHDLQGSGYSIPWKVTAGNSVHRTLKGAKRAIAEHIRNGGIAFLLPA